MSRKTREINIEKAGNEKRVVKRTSIHQVSM